MKTVLLRGFGKKATTALLTVALSIMMVPAAAFAADDTNKKVMADATQQNVSVEVGNVTPSNGSTCIDADAAEGHTATVKAGNLATENNDAITADATTLGTINITAGNVSSDDATGIFAKIEGDGTIKVTAGDVKAGEQGAGVWTSVDNRAIVKPSTATISVGDVTSQGEGIVMRPYGYSEITVTAGDVSSKRNGLEVVTESGANTIVSANDVSSDQSGMFLYVSEGSTLNALITGTLSGKKAPISFFSALFNNPDAVTLAVWKIDYNDSIVMMANPTDADLGAQANQDDEAAQKTAARASAERAIDSGSYTLSPADAKMASSFEKSILYIMKLVQPDAGAKLTATYADGTALKTSSDAFPVVYPVAKEGETVRLKVTLEEGYELLGALDGDGNEVELIKGDDGYYYIDYKVPKGGGIGLSVLLSNPFAGTAAEDEPSAADEPTTKAASSASGGTLPQTGDSSLVLPLALLALLSAFTLALAGAKRNERKREGKGC